MKAKGTGNKVAFLHDPQPPSPHHQEEQTYPAYWQLVSCTAGIVSREFGFYDHGTPFVDQGLPGGDSIHLPRSGQKCLCQQAEQPGEKRLKLEITVDGNDYPTIE